MRIVLVVLLLFVSACSTTEMHQVVISAPAGLTQPDVEVGVIMGMTNTEKVPEYTPGQQITDKALKIAFWPFYRSSSDKSGEWFYDGRTNDAVYARFEYKYFSMRVAAQYTSEKVSLEIIESEALNQKSGRIHKQAYVWLRQLEVRIKRGLSAVAIRNLSPEAKTDSKIKDY